MRLSVAALVVLVFAGGVRADNAEVIKKLQARGTRFVFDEKAKDKPTELYSFKAVDADLELVAQLKSLEILCLQSAKVTDEGMKHLTKMDHVGSLDIWGSKVTPAGLKHVAAIKGLHTLGFGLEHITDEGLKELIKQGLAHKLSLASGKKGRPTSLEDVDYLQLYQVKLTNEGLKELAAFKNLRQLDLSGPNWTGAGLKALAPLKSLTSLEPKPMTDEGLKALREIGMLHSLHWADAAGGKRPKSEEEVTSFLFHSFSYRGVTGVGVRELAGLPNLERLDLSQTYLTHLAMKDVAVLKSLKQLHLGDRVEDEGLKELTSLPLHTLTFLQGTKITDAGMKHIGQMKSLQYLLIWDAKVTTEGLKELKGLKLHTLKIKDERVTDATLKTLRELDLLHTLSLTYGKKGRPTSLTTVYGIHLDRTQVTDEGLKELYGMTGLVDINLDRRKVTDKGVAALKKAIPGLQVER